MAQNDGSTFDENGCLISQVSLFGAERNSSIHPLSKSKKSKRHQGDIKGSGLSIQGDIKDIKGSGLSIPIIYNNLALLFLQKQALNAIFWGKNSV